MRIYPEKFMFYLSLTHPQSSNFLLARHDAPIMAEVSFSHLIWKVKKVSESLVYNANASKYFCFVSAGCLSQQRPKTRMTSSVGVITSYCCFCRYSCYRWADVNFTYVILKNSSEVRCIAFKSCSLNCRLQASSITHSEWDRHNVRSLDLKTQLDKDCPDATLSPWTLVVAVVEIDNFNMSTSH